MKIALLTPTFVPFSGIDRVVDLDAKDYSKKGNNVFIFTLRSEIKPKYAKLVVLGMPKHQTMERLYRLFFFLDFLKIRRYAKQLKGFDLVISYFYPMNLIASHAKKKYGVRWIYWNPGVAFPYLFQTFVERIYLKLFNIFLKLSIKNVDSVISISKFIADQLKKDTGLDSEIRYIQIDKKKFHKGISGSKIRKKYCLGKSPVLLYVGRISPHKGIHFLIKSFNLVLQKFPNTKLLIVGKHTFGSYSKKLQQIANKSVIFTGFVKDKELPYYYAASNLYTTATLWEGYDLPAVEAQACGKPIVAFDLASHPEIIEKGILVKPNDIKGFAEAIIKLLKSKNRIK